MYTPRNAVINKNWLKNAFPKLPQMQRSAQNSIDRWSFSKKKRRKLQCKMGAAAAFKQFVENES